MRERLDDKRGVALKGELERDNIWICLESYALERRGHEQTFDRSHYVCPIGDRDRLVVVLKLFFHPDELILNEVFVIGDL